MPNTRIEQAYSPVDQTASQAFGRHFSSSSDHLDAAIQRVASSTLSPSQTSGTNPLLPERVKEEGTEEGGDVIEWLTIDGLGTVRNSLGAVINLASLPTLSSLPIPAVSMAAAIPFFQVVGGGLILHSALSDTIPTTWKELQTAIKNEDEEGCKASMLAFTNQILFAATGAGLLTTGVTSFLSPIVSSALSYSSIIGSALPTILSYDALGAVCIARGTVMIARSAYNLSYLIPFHNEFRGKLEEENGHDKAIDLLITELGNTPAEEAKLTRRIGTKALDKVKAWKELSEEKNTPEEKLMLLQAVDLGIHELKFKQALIIFIAALMIAGGVCSIIFSGGIAGIAVAIAVSVVFATMETSYISYDSPKAFRWVASKFYHTPEALKTEHSATQPLSKSVFTSA